MPRARLVELLLRDHALLGHPFRAIEVDLRVLELRLRRHLLRLRGGEVRFGLANLVSGLPFLKAESGGALRHLRARALRARGVVRLLLLEFAGIEHADHLVDLHQIALVDRELLDTSGDLGADDHVVGRDDAGEDQRDRPRAQVVVVAGAGDEHQENQRANQAFHVGQTTV